MGRENALPSLNHWSRISLLIFWPRMLLRCERREVLTSTLVRHPSDGKHQPNPTHEGILPLLSLHFSLQAQTIPFLVTRCLTEPFSLSQAQALLEALATRGAAE